MMRINAILDADLKKDDDKFLLAVSDDKAREERLQQLSKLRRMSHKVALIQFVLSLGMLTLDLVLSVTSGDKNIFPGGITIIMGGAALGYLMTFFYFDVQVKFLKAVSSN